MEYTWEQLRGIESGTILHDEYEDGIHFIVMRGSSHLCAYLGIPKTHPLANHDYNLLPIECHGGLTFGQMGDGKNWAKESYWYGWDYGHCDDYAFYYDDPSLGNIKGSGKKWLVKDVIEDSWLAKIHMKDLMKLAEEIHNQALSKAEGGK